jgi:cell division protein FtsB
LKNVNEENDKLIYSNKEINQKYSQAMKDINNLHAHNTEVETQNTELRNNLNHTHSKNEDTVEII